MCNRYSELNFKLGKKVKNRIVVTPMASSTADEEGFVTEETLLHYKRLTASGAGLIFIEFTYVHLSGRSQTNQLGVTSDAHIEGLKKIVKIIHDSGALCALQITHAGGKTQKEFTGGKLLGPSPVCVPVQEGNVEQMTALNLSQIEDLKEAFLTAAGRAQKAGFDFVEFHCAHGYGLNQWLSAITNHRQDQYGGSLKARAKLLTDIVENTKKLYPELLISARVPGQDLLENGLSIKDMVWVLKSLEQKGLDLINVSSGLGGWMRPKDRRGQGYLVYEASEIKKSVELPVIGVGGITDGKYIDQALLDQKFDLAAIGRAILDAPDAWRRTNLPIE